MAENKKRTPRPKYMGKVTMYNQDRGFGFVKCWDDGESYYINKKMMGGEPYLIVGSTIEFEIWTSKDDPNKKFAGNVLVVEVPDEKRRSNKY